MSDPKVLFVIPPGRSWGGGLVRQLVPPIGLAYLIAYLRKNGCSLSVAVCDVSQHYRHREQMLRRSIEQTSPDLIGIGVFTPVMAECREIISCIKSLTQAPIVVGGPHISVTGDEFLRETGAGYGILMDGEVPLLRLMQTLFGGRGSGALETIPGLAFKDSAGQYHVNPNTELIHDLDRIPFPDWSDFDMSLYPTFRQVYTVLTSRGCPYGCTYCGAPLVTGRRYRMRSAGNVLDEIEIYYRKGYRRFGVFDDAFNVDMERAKAICRMLVERKIEITWDLANGIRADRMDLELVQLLKKSGCNFIGIGGESGNDDMLRKIRKGVDTAGIRRAVDLANEVGIGSAVNFIFGHPDETYETACDTLRFAASLPASYVNMYGLLPMRGTSAYEELRAREKQGRARFFFPYEHYISHMNSTGVDPVFETPEFTRSQRRSILKKGRNLTKRTAMTYRFGPVLGRVVYWMTLSNTVFIILNGLRETRLGNLIYFRTRRED